MKGHLKHGPAAGRVVEAGDPPIRRGIVVVGDGTFGEDAHRYYLSAVDDTEATYLHGGRVPWPPEASAAVVARTPVGHETTAAGPDSDGRTPA
jgi:hypothetical protein